MSDVIYATSKKILDQKREAWKLDGDLNEAGKDIMSLLCE